jgi:protein-tyrosine phosphatase
MARQFHNPCKLGSDRLSLRPMNILMVCLGNICRSPLAEGILQDKIRKYGLPWTVDSAGTNGIHTGEAPHRLSQKVARHHGIDISGQRARDFEPADVERFDLIFAMAGDVVREIRHIAGNRFDADKTELLMNLVHPGRNLDVPDPWYGPEAGYHEVFSMIDQACEALVRKFNTGEQKTVGS